MHGDAERLDEACVLYRESIRKLHEAVRTSVNRVGKAAVNPDTECPLCAGPTEMWGTARALIALAATR